MRVTVFGATGSIGQGVVQRLLEDGHDVTVMARNPAKLTQTNPHLSVITGQLSDAGAVRHAIANSDVVISTLGPPVTRSGAGTPLTDGTRTILAAMNAEHVKRYIGVSSPMLFDSRDRPLWRHKFVAGVGKFLFPYTLREMTGMAAAVADADVDYTIVRLTRPVYKPATGAVRAGYLGRDRLGGSITRPDLARFVVSQITDTRYIRGVPVISN